MLHEHSHHVPWSERAIHPGYQPVWTDSVSAACSRVT